MLGVDECRHVLFEFLKANLTHGIQLCPGLESHLIWHMNHDWRQHPGNYLDHRCRGTYKPHLLIYDSCIWLAIQSGLELNLQCLVTPYNFLYFLGFFTFMAFACMQFAFFQQVALNRLFGVKDWCLILPHYILLYSHQSLLINIMSLRNLEVMHLILIFKHCSLPIQKMRWGAFSTPLCLLL